MNTKIININISEKDKFLYKSLVENNHNLLIPDRPVTYLYNTLHYYERKLRDRPSLKRRLVSAVLGSLREIRAPGWALSEAYQIYMTHSVDNAVAWIPELDYYIRLVQRIVESKTKIIFILN
jgi:hypothetical protein